MRFALLGNHPDGVEMACALVESGRHHLAAYTAALDEMILRRLGGAARRVSDPEEVLADPAVAVVVVAGAPSQRPAQLRRALQAERHVLCVHPADDSPEIAYEAAMIQRDTGCVLLPLLPEGLHPGLARLRQFVGRPTKDGRPLPPAGAFLLLEVERVAAGEVLDGVGTEGRKPSFPDWEVLRALGGEVLEVSAFAAEEEPTASGPVLLAGRFEEGGLFQVTLVPGQPAPWRRLAVVGSAGRAELLFPLGWQGPAFLEWRDEGGETREEYWERWGPWPALVEAFESALRRPAVPGPLREAVTAGAPVPRAPVAGGPLSWQDEVRCLELDDAARRSVGRRRSSLLEYPEATEEAGFKGTMTLAGCGLLWLIILLVILAHFFPPQWWKPLGWGIGALLVVFLGSQLLRYLIPGRAGGGGAGRGETR
jgi:predicted dehydrogenase